MSKNVDDHSTMFGVQGDKVLVFRKHPDGAISELVMTFVTAVDIESRHLRLVNREDKHCSPDWRVSQSLFDAVKPAETNNVGAKWQLAVKAT